MPLLLLSNVLLTKLLSYHKLQSFSHRTFLTITNLLIVLRKKINPIYFISSIEIDFLLKRLITSKYYVMTEVRSGGDDKLLGIQFDKFIPHTERGQETAEMTMRQLS